MCGLVSICLPISLSLSFSLSLSIYLSIYLLQTKLRNGSEGGIKVRVRQMERRKVTASFAFCRLKSVNEMDGRRNKCDEEERIERIVAMEE